MKALVISDLHVEFMSKKIQRDPTMLGINFSQDCDVVIVAGDVHPGIFGLEWLRKLFQNKRIIVVAGNHEFYSRELYKHYEKLREKAKELDIDFLQNKYIYIDGVKFIGATLWTDFNLLGNQPLAMLNAKDMMNDYQKIKTMHSNKLIPQVILSQHETSRDFIQTELQNDTCKKVVITHHAPCELSVAEQYKHDLTSACYASRLENFMYYFGPEYWIHGHTHYSFDYMVHDTRVICNPYGYYGHATNPNFNPTFVIEI